MVRRAVARGRGCGVILVAHATDGGGSIASRRLPADLFAEDQPADVPAGPVLIGPRWACRLHHVLNRSVRDSCCSELTQGPGPATGSARQWVQCSPT